MQGLFVSLSFLHIRIQELNTLTVNEYLLYTSDFINVMKKDALRTNLRLSNLIN